jgi:hypothetical protein
MAKRGGGCLKFVLGLILIPMILGSGLWFLSNLNRVLTHQRVDAVVIDLIPSTDSDGDTVYKPVYQYDVDGQTYRYTSLVSLGGLAVPDIGDQKTLLYNADDPGDARVRNMFLLLVLPAILVLIPLLILVALGWSAMRRRRRTEDWSAPSTNVPPWSPPAEFDPTGDTITAIFMGTEPSQMDAKGDVRYRVKARAEIDGELRRFVGEWVDEDPTLMFMARGNTVEVRIDPSSPTIYEVIMPTAD